jgi:hypothetical protein
LVYGVGATCFFCFCFVDYLGKPSFNGSELAAEIGVIPAEASPNKPSGLPIEFATTKFQNLKEHPSMSEVVGSIDSRSRL